MTIRELADTAGCSEKTVRRIVSDKMPGRIQNGRVTRFDWAESHKIMEWLPKKNLVSNLGQKSELPSQNVQGSNLNEKDMALIAGIVAAVFSKLDSRIGAVENRIAERGALLPPPHIKPRDNINKLVREYATTHQIGFQGAWGELYKEFSYRTNSNPRLSAKNRGMGILDYIEAEGLIDVLESVAIDWSST